MNQSLYRFGLLKKLNENHEVGVIYAYVQSVSAKEHRPTLQHIQHIQHIQQYGDLTSISFSGRSRIEIRFFEDNKSPVSFSILLSFFQNKNRNKSGELQLHSRYAKCRVHL